MTDNGMWEDLESHRRPRGVSEAEAKRAEGVDPSSTLGATDAANVTAPSSAPPEMAIWPPDEWDMLARIEKLEAKIIELETMLAMAVQVASKAAQIANDAADQAVRAAKASIAAAEVAGRAA